MLAKRLFSCVLCLLLVFTLHGQHTPNTSLEGKVFEMGTSEILAYATVAVYTSKELRSNSYTTLSDDEGNYNLRALPSGATLYIKCFYMGKVSPWFELKGDAKGGKLTYNIIFDTSHLLGPVVVTAVEGRGPSSSVLVGRNAIEHLQPNSFADIVSLLPGGKTLPPNMSSFNAIRLREVGPITPRGTSTQNDNYAISSLGTSFYVDGAPFANDANLQYTPSGYTSQWEMHRSGLNWGVDMRTISPDNIEKIEFVTGIPSVEYGNLTSGVVLISRKSSVLPPSGRFKADGYSKLAYAESGIAFSKKQLGKHHFNFDFGYLDSKSDPRNALINYKRFTGSTRYYGKIWGWNWFASADYTGSFDNAKQDSDVSYGGINQFYSSYNRLGGTTSAHYLSSLAGEKGWTEVKVQLSFSQQWDKLKEQRLVAPIRASLAPSSYDEGESDAQMLLGEYVGHYVSYGRPFNLNLMAKATYFLPIANLLDNDFKGGLEYDLVKNFGRGQVYDLRYPISIGNWDTRPRSYASIPAMHTVTAYVESSSRLRLGDHNQFLLRAGLRATMLLSDHRFDLNGKPYLDPRINLQWQTVAFAQSRHPLRLSFDIGYGTTHRMPTLNYLFPDMRYIDLVQLNYYDVYHPLEHSRFNLRTYIRDVSSYNLQPTKNQKVDARIKMHWGNGFTLSVSGFYEKMNTGFRYNTSPEAYTYKVYDHTAIDASQLTAPPSLDGLPYTEHRILKLGRQPENGTLIIKKGLEFQIVTPRIPYINTGITVNGAYYHSTYSNSVPLYVGVSDVVDHVAVRDRYMGLYRRDDGNSNRRFNTNVMLDTQIPSYGLIFSTTVECVWFTSTRRMPMEGKPFAYFSAIDGQLHDYTMESEKDLFLVHLRESFNNALFREVRIPGNLSIHLKLTKTVGKHLKIALFAQNFWDHTPDYKSNEIIVRRNLYPYFGMELQLKH